MHDFEVVLLHDTSHLSQFSLGRCDTKSRSGAREVVSKSQGRCLQNEMKHEKPEHDKISWHPGIHRHRG